MTAGTRSDSPIHAHILLVDDNRSGLAARKTILEELGHRITTAVGGEDALEVFAVGKFDLIVTDYRMPKLDGVELIKRVRSADPAIPVIMLSGYVDACSLDEENTGADVVLPKSANEVAHLIRSVNRLLRRKAPKRPPATHRPQPKAKRRTAGH